MAQHPLHDLLLACLRVTPTPTLTTDLAQLSPSDWQQLLQLSQQQHISPLFYHRLKEHQLSELVTPAVRQQLQQLQLANSVRNMRINHELRRLAAAFQAVQIPIIVLKGAYLAAAVYPNPALRFMADLDLLVPQAALPAVVALLQQQGYEPVIPIVLEAHTQTSHHLPPFRHAERVVGVEIHWTITTPDDADTVNIGQFWAQAQPITIAGMLGQTFCPEDLLLHICVHATYHHYFAQDIRYLCDIDAIVRRYPTLDWQLLIARAKQRRWTRGVHTALYLTRQLLGTAIPDQVIAALGPTHLSNTIVETIMAEMFADKVENRRISLNFIELWQVGQASARSKIMLQRLFVSPTMLASIYSISPRSPKVLFYYLVRLKDLVLRYSGKSWQLWRGQAAAVTQVTRNHQLTHWLHATTDHE